MNLKEINQNDKKIFSVSDYVKIVNEGLKNFRSRIIGEISEINIGPTGHIYFTLKDSNDGSIIRCVIWKTRYDLYGIEMKEGSEIIASGCPSLHPKYGFKFIADVVEFAGEGSLKKEYERLKRELEKEGLFAVERKKSIPDFPRKIGLITSERGAVIHDFLNNLGKYGYSVKFMNSRVEGQAAVRDLIFAVDYFRKSKDIDALVIIRGGGSLESLQAFNNETLVRKISDCGFPVICGIGHDKDIPLASLAADKAVSTPTAVTSILDESWEKAVNKITLFERDIVYKYQEMLKDVRYYLEGFSNKLNKHFGAIFQKFERLNSRFRSTLINIDYNIKKTRGSFVILENSLFENFKRWIENNKNFLDIAEKQLKIFNPVRQLKFGYSIVYSAGKIIKSVSQVKTGEEVDIRVSDGKIISKIKNINNYGKRKI